MVHTAETMPPQLPGPTGSRLLGRVASDEKIDVVQLIFLLRVSLWVAYRFRRAESFFPGADPCFIEIARFVAGIVQNDCRLR